MAGKGMHRCSARQLATGQPQLTAEPLRVSPSSVSACCSTHRLWGQVGSVDEEATGKVAAAGKGGRGHCILLKRKVGDKVVSRDCS